jgi:adenylate cyclase
VAFVLRVILPTALRNARFAFTFLLLGLGFIATLQYLPLRSMPSPEMKYAEQGGAASVLTFVAKDPKSEWFLSANKPEAAAYCLRGWDYYSRFTPEANAQARQMFERAVAIDPQYPTAYVSLGWTYILEWSSLWTQEAHSLDQALVMAQRALTLNNALPYAHALLSSVYLYRKEYELALAAAERAVALEPACADCFALLADILTVTGQARKAIEMIEHARHLDPSSAASYAATLGRAYYLIGQPGLAAETLRRAVIRNPTALVPRLNLALAYSEIGRVQKARAEISEVLRLNPHLTLQALREHMPHQNPGQAEYLLASLHKVGLQ